MATFGSLPFYIHFLEDALHTTVYGLIRTQLIPKFDSPFFRQIWSFSRPFVCHIILPFTSIIDASCLRLTCVHCAAARFMAYTVAHSREEDAMHKTLQS